MADPILEDLDSSITMSSDPEIEWMDIHHTWCTECGDYFGNELYEREHADHD